VIISCDDGDIIVTSFDFEAETLERCTDFEYLFYKINTDNNESLALQFTGNDEFLTEAGEVNFSLTGSNQLVYRRFKGDVGGDYFCNAIPPTSPTVAEQFSSAAGSVQIITQGSLLDNDGIPSEVEDPTGLVDTDTDGLPNIIDEDDDGDNIPTLLEGVEFDDDGNIDMMLSLDTDGDGVPNFLDADDDGDGVPTINEDINMDLNPLNDIPMTGGVPNYLDNTLDDSVVITEFIEHTYFFRDIEITINLGNLDMRNENGEEVLRDQRTIEFGTFTGAADLPIVVSVPFNR